MTLLETYSHCCGVKPSDPFIWEDYYPIAFDKYLVVQAGAGMPTKQYDMWDYVLEHVKIKKIQVGGKDDQKLPVDLSLCGSTTWGQTAYILKRATLFIGCDSVCNHMASAFGVPRIALFGPTSPLTCGGAYDRSRAIEIAPVDMRGCTAPCHYSRCLRPDKCINSIKPEIVLDNIKAFLGEGSIQPVQILHIGKQSKTPYIEWLPGSCGQEEFNILRQFVGAINVRVDEACDLEALSHLCNSINVKLMFMMSPRNVDQFEVSPLKSEQIYIEVDKTNIQEGIKTMKSLASKMHKVRLLSTLPSSEFNAYKLEIMDFPPIEKRSEDYDISLERLVGNCYNIKTERKILAHENKFFLTIYDAKKNQNNLRIEEDNGTIKLEKDHLKESSYFAIKRY